MATITFRQDFVKQAIGLVKPGSYFLGQVSNEVYVRGSGNISIRLFDGMSFTDEYMSRFGPVSVITNGDISIKI
jgi:hypothetical protein